MTSPKTPTTPPVEKPGKLDWKSVVVGRPNRNAGGHESQLRKLEREDQKLRNRRYSDEQQKIPAVQAEGSVEKLTNGKRPQFESAH